MIIRKKTASCKWSFGGTGLLKLIILRIRPLANDHLEGPAICKWTSWGSGLFNWPSGGTGLSQMIIRQPRHPSHLCQDPDSILWTFLGQFFLFFIDVFTKQRGRQILVSFFLKSFNQNAGSKGESCVKRLKRPNFVQKKIFIHSRWTGAKTLQK